MKHFTSALQPDITTRRVGMTDPAGVVGALVGGGLKKAGGHVVDGVINAPSKIGELLKNHGYDIGKNLFQLATAQGLSTLMQNIGGTQVLGDLSGWKGPTKLYGIQKGIEWYKTWEYNGANGGIDKWGYRNVLAPVVIPMALAGVDYNMNNDTARSMLVGAGSFLGLHVFRGLKRKSLDWFGVKMEDMDAKNDARFGGAIGLAGEAAVLFSPGAAIYFAQREGWNSWQQGAAGVGAYLVADGIRDWFEDGPTTGAAVAGKAVKKAANLTKRGAQSAARGAKNLAGKTTTGAKGLWGKVKSMMPWSGDETLAHAGGYNWSNSYKHGWSKSGWANNV